MYPRLTKMTNPAKKLVKTSRIGKMIASLKQNIERKTKKLNDGIHNTKQGYFFAISTELCPFFMF